MLQFQAKTSNKNTGSIFIILPVIFLISCGNNSENYSHYGFRSGIKNTAEFSKPAVLKQIQAIPENSAAFKIPAPKAMEKIFRAVCLLKTAAAEHNITNPVKIIKKIKFLLTLFGLSNLDIPAAFKYDKAYKIISGGCSV